MNKKMYFEPEMEVIDLKLQGMLCASGDIDDGDPVPMGGSDEEEGDGL